MALLKILAVEDNEEQIELLKRMLGRLIIPSEIKIIKTGEEAVEYMKNAGGLLLGHVEFPDLIFLDLNLPGESGLEVLQQFKTLLGRNIPPVIIVSATIKDADKVAAYKYGAVCFLSKPYQEDALNEVMVQLRMTGRLKIPAA